MHLTNFDVIVKSIFSLGTNTMASSPAVCSSLLAEATSLGALGQRQAALEKVREALAIQRSELPEGHIDMAITLHMMGNLLGSLASCGDALGKAAEALPFRRPYVVLDLANNRQQHEEALGCHEEALGIRQRALSDNHADVAMSFSRVANELGALGQHEQALDMVGKALLMQRSAQPELHADVAMSLLTMANSLAALDKHEEALEKVREALAIQRRELPEGHIDMATTLNTMGTLLSALYMDDDALDAHNEALEIRERANPTHPDIQMSQDYVSMGLMGVGCDIDAALLFLQGFRSDYRTERQKKQAVALDGPALPS